ncbi:MAG: hypothetical protein HFG47_04835 [Lachnospiraceae bacterium]|nr:hypothetical protein [Lachnospiraceae bacterium]
MNNMPNNKRYRKSKSLRAVSYAWATVMAVCALAALFAAMWVVITVYEKIAGDSSEWIVETTKESSTELIIEAEEAYGWITDNQGSRYREDDGSFAKDSWKIWEDKLYYLKEDGFMATEEIKKDGQIFIFASDGALTDIQQDFQWAGLTGENNLQSLDSLVKGYEFWAYLSSDAGSTGVFKPILYRKTTETKEKFLGSEVNPEKSTKNSLQIHNGYIYYLPQVSSQVFNSLGEKEKILCNKLFRMKPGESQKELLAENATGYLVLEDGTVYYASSGEILKAEAGTVYSAGDDQYRVQVRDDGCYLLDSMGNLVTGDASGIQIIGSREYRLSEGKIIEVNPAQQKYENFIFTLEGDPENAGRQAIYRQEDGGEKVKIAQALWGINSFCIAQDNLYYSAFVEQGTDGTRYSEIYRMKPDSMQAEKISSRFKGNILKLYYYEGKGKIYGEYAPVSWMSCYGQIVTVAFDGTVTLIDDSLSRGSSDMSRNDLLSLVMVNENTVTTYMQTCEYRSDVRTWNMLSEKPYQFADTMQIKVADSFLNVPSDQRTEEETEESSPEENSEDEEEEGTQSRQESRESQERPGSRPQETQGETGNRPQETQRGTGSRPQETQRGTGSRPQETQREQGNPVNNQEGQTSQTAPNLPERPAEPGSAPTAQAQEAPGAGNSGTMPTIEANPESNTPGVPIRPGSPEDSVQYIGPGGQ